MKEKEIEKKFNKIKKIMIKKFPSTTTNIQLNKFCKKLFGKYFIGVYSADRIKPLKCNQSQIINLDPSYMGGSHWTVCARDYRHKLYFYDSFGRDLKKILPLLKKKFNEPIYYDTKDKEQGNNNTCGAHCIAWLICFYKYGGANVIKI